ncbi:hypothetical protein [Trinickia mobilis]|uniref:hypothetical protein n=1 Tax=Trinickia mobilis TaxID=2816356 RepID=UPI001A8EA899|nr:hypothetical protein [Trinickia mobilis]
MNATSQEGVVKHRLEHKHQLSIDGELVDRATKLSGMGVENGRGGSEGFCNSKTYMFKK